MPRLLRAVVVAVCVVGLGATGCTRFNRPMMQQQPQDDFGQSSKASDGSADSSGASADSSGASGDSSDASGDSSGSSDGSGSDSNSNSGSGDGGTASATVSVAIVFGILGLIWLAQLSRMGGGGGGGNPLNVGGLDHDEALDEAQAWLTRNRRQVRADIARGAGAFVDELAVAHQVPGPMRPRLGAALQRARAALDGPLAAGAPSRDDTARFAAALGDALYADPQLARHIEAGLPRLAHARPVR